MIPCRSSRLDILGCTRKRGLLPFCLFRIFTRYVLLIASSKQIAWHALYSLVQCWLADLNILCRNSLYERPTAGVALTRWPHSNSAVDTDRRFKREAFPVYVKYWHLPHPSSTIVAD